MDQAPDRNGGGEDDALRALILPVELAERPRVLTWSPADHDIAEVMLRREIGCQAVTPWVASGVGVWHDAEARLFQPLNPRASWFTYVAEEPTMLTGTCVILQSCCMNGLTQSWINIVLESIATMPDPWEVSLKLGLNLGSDS